MYILIYLTTKYVVTYVYINTFLYSALLLLFSSFGDARQHHSSLMTMARTFRVFVTTTRATTSCMATCSYSANSFSYGFQSRCSRVHDAVSAVGRNCNVFGPVVKYELVHFLIIAWHGSSTTPTRQPPKRKEQESSKMQR